jgi:hypothetical protein
MKKIRVSLQSSEGVVARIAGRIYSAYVAAGRVPEGKEEDWMQRSVREAIRLAQIAEESVQSDEELD